MHDKITADTGAQLVNRVALSADHALASTRRLTNEAIDGLAGSVEDLRSAAGPALGRVTGQAGALMQDGLDAVRDGSRQVSREARHVQADTLHYIRHEPMKSVLMAAATGAVLMALVSLLAGRRG